MKISSCTLAVDLDRSARVAQSPGRSADNGLSSAHARR